MSNWVTLPNGVHIDLDDPNNPITGSGSFDELCSPKTEATTKVLYHQTKAKSLSDFSTDKKGAGISDSETPSGIFLKDDDTDIGLEGKNQLKMEVEMKKPLVVDNREQLVEKVKQKSEKYRALKQKEAGLDSKYEELNQKLEEEDDDAYYKYYYAKTEVEKAKYQAKMDDIESRQDKLQDDWRNETIIIAQQCQREMTKVLKAEGYDSVIINKDVGNFGRAVKSYIVFDLKQLKQID